MRLVMKLASWAENPEGVREQHLTQMTQISMIFAREQQRTERKIVFGRIQIHAKEYE
mgnify:CR=1 FL=1